ncbi:hypothetical protein BDZ85DRAFT_255695 [Elsinoe ampelina]|uniref:Uncharacterized protein n=1 Tax=Elsinoe ampelina TaxID=302913 RepID=A0A6A6GRB0_9PEZI|nr:hypothetical protein BDZ85DRAFT_255695 [Elsinoe ampelina]
MLEGIYGVTKEVVASLMGKGVVFVEPRAGRYEFVQRWMPHVYDTDDEGYKAHALVSLISMTWVRQHLGHGPFGPQKGDVLPYFVYVESFLSESPDHAPYKAWVKHTLSLLDKQQPSLVTKMLDNRAAQTYAAITQVLTAVTSLKLTDDEKNNIATIADQATALSNELWKSPTAWRLIPMGLNFSEKDSCPTFKNEAHMALDVEDGVELPYDTPMHGVVFPGLSEVKRVDGKAQTTAKAKVKVVCTEPEGKEEGESAGEQPSTRPKKTPEKTSDRSLEAGSEKTLGTSPEGGSEKGARTTPEGTPEKTPEETPERTSEEAPKTGAKRRPESTPEGSPEKSPRRSPKKTPAGT